MYSDHNLIYFFTILEAIEKINIYAQDCQDDEALKDALNSNFYIHLQYLKKIS